MITLSQKSSCHSRLTSPSSPSDSMDIINNCCWSIVVNYMLNWIYIDTSGCNISANNHINFSISQIFQCSLSLLLSFWSMQGWTLVAKFILQILFKDLSVNFLIYKYYYGWFVKLLKNFGQYFFLLLLPSIDKFNFLEYLFFGTSLFPDLDVKMVLKVLLS